MLLLVLLVQAPAAQGGSPRLASLEGTVVAAGTNRPIEGAVVILARAGNSLDLSDEDSRSMTTGPQGRFAFTELEAGAYRLAFERNGYVRQEYGQKTFPGRGMTLELRENQRLRDLTVGLTAAGSISGRILDDDNQPVADLSVQLIRASYLENGKRAWQVHGTARTDDRGEYRLYFITPGSYYLRAGTPQGANGATSVRPSPNSVPAAYASRHYPGVTSLQEAARITVRPGVTVNGIDMTLDRQQLFRVRGRIIDTATGAAPAQVTIWLTYRVDETGFEYPLAQFGGDAGVYSNGVFEFRNVVPGSYGLSATMAAPASMGHIPVEVLNADIDDLELPISPAGSISGRVDLEGARAVAAAFSERGKPWVLLAPVNDAGGDARGIEFKSKLPGFPGKRYGDVQPDGTFEIGPFLPGAYELSVRGFDPAMYVKDAEFGGADALGRPLRITGRESGGLTLRLASTSSALVGSVTGRAGAAAGAHVVLVPDQSRHRADLYRAVTTDQHGRFAMSRIVPGDYKVYAWAAIEPYAWFDPQVLARDESSARSLRVLESSSHTIALRAIVPAR
jgi:protocatechuate 3,4-dioxygenase beta subunit